MRKIWLYVLIGAMTLLLAACGETVNPDTIEEGPSVITDPEEISVTPEGLAWREAVVNSPVIAEVEHKGTTYEIHVKDSVKYIHNTSTNEIITGTATGDANAIVLKDWIAPYGQELLQPSEALFEATWEYTSARIRSLIGYCDANFTLVTRARTAEYLEYIYEDKANDIVYRIAVTDDFILFAPLMFTYVFDVNAY